MRDRSEPPPSLRFRVGRDLISACEDLELRTVGSELSPQHVRVPSPVLAIS